MTTKTPLEWQEEQLITQEQGWKDLVVAWTKAVAVEVLDPDCDKVLAVMKWPSVNIEKIGDFWFLWTLLREIERAKPACQQEMLANLNQIADFNNDEVRDQILQLFFKAIEQIISWINAKVNSQDLIWATKNPLKTFLWEDAVAEVEAILSSFDDGKLDSWSTEPGFMDKLTSWIVNGFMWMIKGGKKLKQKIWTAYKWDQDRYNQLKAKKTEINKMVDKLKKYPRDGAKNIVAYEEALLQLAVLKIMFSTKLKDFIEQEYKDNPYYKQYLKDIDGVVSDIDQYTNVLELAKQSMLAMINMSWIVAQQLEKEYALAIFKVDIAMITNGSTELMSLSMGIADRMVKLWDTSVKSMIEKSSNMADSILALEASKRDSLLTQIDLVAQLNQSLQTLDTDLDWYKAEISSLNWKLREALDTTHSINTGKLISQPDSLKITQ